MYSPRTNRASTVTDAETFITRPPENCDFVGARDLIVESLQKVRDVIERLCLRFCTKRGLRLLKQLRVNGRIPPLPLKSHGSPTLPFEEAEVEKMLPQTRSLRTASTAQGTEGE